MPRDDGRDDVAPFTRPVAERDPPEVGASEKQKFNYLKIITKNFIPGLSKSALDRLEVDRIPETSESALLPPLPF